MKAPQLFRQVLFLPLRSELSLQERNGNERLYKQEKPIEDWYHLKLSQQLQKVIMVVQWKVTRHLEYKSKNTAELKTSTQEAKNKTLFQVR